MMNYNLNPYDHCKAEADPKPELSTITLQINLAFLNSRLAKARKELADAYLAWLQTAEQLRNRLRGDSDAQT